MGKKRNTCNPEVAVPNSYDSWKTASPYDDPRWESPSAHGPRDGGRPCHPRTGCTECWPKVEGAK